VPTLTVVTPTAQTLVASGSNLNVAGEAAGGPGIGGDPPVKILYVTVQVDAQPSMDAAIVPVKGSTYKVTYSASAPVGGVGWQQVTVTAIDDNNLTTSKTVPFMVTYAVGAAVLIGPRWNRQVTCDSDPNNDRSESELVVNPRDPYNLVGASKKFTDPAHYNFSLAPYASFDGTPRGPACHHHKRSLT
jgi:hypothetical protein